MKLQNKCIQNEILKRKLLPYSPGVLLCNLFSYSHRTLDNWKFNFLMFSSLRKIFGPKREEDGSCRKLHNDELHDLYSSPNIVRVIESRRMR
jgi:hypothetical protein